MKKNSSPFITGIMAGLAAGLVLPSVTKKVKEWAKSPEGKKTLEEVLPTEAEQKQVKEIWENGEKAVAEGVSTLKKQWNSLVGTAKKTVERAADEASDSVAKTSQKAARKVNSASTKTAAAATKTARTGARKTKQAAKTVAKKSSV